MLAAIDAEWRTLPATRVPRPGETMRLELPTDAEWRRGKVKAVGFTFISAPDAGGHYEHGGWLLFIKGRWVCLPPFGF
ncbi:MAG: hypothetical protein ACOZQL_19260 [Myxococcota bacterium]